MGLKSWFASMTGTGAALGEVLREGGHYAGAVSGSEVALRLKQDATSPVRYVGFALIPETMIEKENQKICFINLAPGPARALAREIRAFADEAEKPASA